MPSYVPVSLLSSVYSLWELKPISLNNLCDRNVVFFCRDFLFTLPSPFDSTQRRRVFIASFQFDTLLLKTTPLIATLPLSRPIFKLLFGDAKTTGQTSPIHLMIELRRFVVHLSISHTSNRVVVITLKEWTWPIATNDLNICSDSR